MGVLRQSQRVYSIFVRPSNLLKTDTSSVSSISYCQPNPKRSPSVGSVYVPVTGYISSPFSQRNKEFFGQKLVGFNMEQMYNVVADVGNYKNFVPFCKKSNIISKSEKQIEGYLEVGFPPVVERYTSHLVLQRPTLIKATCRDGILFDYLTTTWEFLPGLKTQAQSCIVNFHVSFEFKSLLYSQLAHLFFNELVSQMESAFILEAERRYGPPSIGTVKLISKTR